MTPAVFGHGDLRLYLLALIEESPKHGYEIIHTLSKKFGGTYSPSAGTIYPRLTKLEREGLVVRAHEGRKSIYSITPAGVAELNARQPELDQIENELGDSIRLLADEVRSELDSAMRFLRAELAHAANEARQFMRNDSQEYDYQHTIKLDTPVDAATKKNQQQRLVHEIDLILRNFLRQVGVDTRLAATKNNIPVDLAPKIEERLRTLHTEIQQNIFTC